MTPSQSAAAAYSVPRELVEQADEIAFRHGFLLRRGGRDKVPAAWGRRVVGPLELATHPATDVSHAHGQIGGEEVHVLLIGQAVDLTGDVRAGDLADRLLQRAHDFDQLIDYVAYLAGRFVALVLRPHVVDVIPDCTAAQAVVWSMTEEGAAIASHGALVAQALDRPGDDRTLAEFARVREVRPRGTVYLHGTGTPYDAVRPVFANCRLRLDLGEWSAEHVRFAPLTSRVERTDFDGVVDEIHDLVDKHIRGLASLGPLGLSMTHGGDSLITSLAVQPHKDEHTFAYTYVNPRDLARSEAVGDDVFGASARAFRLGIPHRVIRWRSAPEGTPFDLAARITWPVNAPSLGAAFAMYEDLPHDFLELQSTVAEAGTAFYDPGVRLDVIDGTRLAGLWGTPRAEVRRDYVDAFTEYIDYTEFSREALRGYDPRNHFYWEHRLTRWAAVKYQVGDLGHRVALPLNQRGIVEAMLSLPVEHREEKAVLPALAQRFAQGPIGDL